MTGEAASRPTTSRLPDQFGLAVAAVVMLSLLVGCLGNDSVEGAEPELPTWTQSLFAEVEGLTPIAIDDMRAVFEFRGDASDMVQTIVGRLTEADFFMLHHQLAVTGEMNSGQVQVVWTRAEPGKAPGLTDGTWNVDATLTSP